jgi:hypothetical protein
MRLLYFCDIICGTDAFWIVLHTFYIAMFLHKIFTPTCWSIKTNVRGVKINVSERLNQRFGTLKPTFRGAEINVWDVHQIKAWGR